MSSNVGPLAGSYDIQSRSIEVDPTVVDPAISLLHELAHHVDFALLAQGATPGSGTSRLDPWRRAVQRTRAVNMLVRRHWTPMRVLGTLVAADPTHLLYLLELEELFARSYAQYIVVKSGNPTLLSELNQSPRLRPSREVLYPEQWDDADFRDVADAIDDLMKELNWAR